MKNMKKLVSLLLAVCLMASLAIGASAAEPTTVDVSGVPVPPASACLPPRTAPSTAILLRRR